MFAALRELAGSAWVDVEAADVGELRRHVAERFGPEFERILAAGTVVVDGDVAADDAPLAADSEVALLPPVSGGRDRGRSRRVLQS